MLTLPVLLNSDSVTDIDLFEQQHAPHNLADAQYPYLRKTNKKNGDSITYHYKAEIVQQGN
jgi:hypothetical protein